MYALSSCWNSSRHIDGRAMLREIRDLGFEYAELSHGIRLSLVPGILDAVDAGEIKICSLHNFCPLPIGVTHASPNVFKFTALDPRERESALRHTLKTLEFAERVHAPLVVLHLGEVEMKEYTDTLIEMTEEGQRDTPKYQRLCAEVDERRELRKTQHIMLAYDMLRRIAEQAAARNIKLGIENREAIEEIPFEGDFPFFFREFDTEVVRYWHDTGHAQIKENLGFISHTIHLESLAGFVAGFHVHDVEFPAHDHRPPGQGTIDFAALKPYVKPEHPKVLELHPNLPSEAVLAGLAHIKSIWGES
ncbi:MAG: sugar phosphate isomerase/epimerase [Verrucomicrobia bacterium]|nr:sugar phosphate isomerase/epimerase [Verrucomicrobiota bacterium]